jgi:uracil-DNA glycosylase
VLPSTRVIICLGKFGYDALLTGLSSLGAAVPKPRPKFGHAVEVSVGSVTVLGCFHPSQQNTFTGRLTEATTDAILTRARLPRRSRPTRHHHLAQTP